MGEYFSSNCREELDGHVNCAKVFLEQHVKFGTPYTPGGGDATDPCRLTRSLYMRCMASRRAQGLEGEKATRDVAQGLTVPKVCEMELSMHGNCVSNQLERTQRLGEKYWTQGGEDKCLMTRANYEQCMYRSLRADADDRHDARQSTDLERHLSHLQVDLQHK